MTIADMTSGVVGPEDGHLPHDNATLQSQIVFLRTMCAHMEDQLARGGLALPTKDFTAMSSALQTLKKANVAPKEKRGKKALDTSATGAPVARLGSFIRRHLQED